MIVSLLSIVTKLTTFQCEPKLTKSDTPTMAAVPEPTYYFRGYDKYPCANYPTNNTICKNGHFLSAQIHSS